MKGRDLLFPVDEWLSFIPQDCSHTLSCTREYVHLGVDFIISAFILI